MPVAPVTARVGAVPTGPITPVEHGRLTYWTQSLSR